MSAETDDTPSEADLNRGIVTVFEQTKDTETFDAGERYLGHGYDTRKYILDDENERFVCVAVPLAHIELPEPMTEEEYSEWLNSDAGQLAVARFFPECECDDVLTEWGVEKLQDGDQS